MSGLENATTLNDLDTFISACLKAIQPFIELRVDYAKKYEDVEARDIMEKQGYISLNERVSYSKEGDRIQLHLATAFEVKEKIEDLYRDALYKIVEIVKSNPTILFIGGSSWINATRTYGGMKERLGFSLSETSDEVFQKHHTKEARPVKDATMTRDEFLRRYSK